MIRLEQGSHLPISVIMADVDGLKLINDALGHQEGDLLLQTVADVLRKRLALATSGALGGG